MVNTEYAIACKEIVEILKYISIEDYNKIPKEKINVFEKNADIDYVFNYNPDITLEEQNVSKITKAIIIILFRDYWATKEQKEKIQTRQNKYFLEVEKEKSKRYNPDNIFKSNENENKDNSINVSIIEYKESFFKKIINKIKKILKKK